MHAGPKWGKVKVLTRGVSVAGLLLAASLACTVSQAKKNEQTRNGFQAMLTSSELVKLCSNSNKSRFEAARYLAESVAILQRAPAVAAQNAPALDGSRPQTASDKRAQYQASSALATIHLQLAKAEFQKNAQAQLSREQQELLLAAVRRWLLTRGQADESAKARFEDINPCDESLVAFVVKDLGG
jgi:hypothetical protein